MTPTREQIEAVYSDMQDFFSDSWCSKHLPAVNFMRDAALSKLDSEPFKPGEVVVHEQGGLDILVCTGEPINNDCFCGVVIKVETGPPTGEHSNAWQINQFTRKTVA